MRTAEKQLKSNRCKFTEELKEAKIYCITWPEIQTA